MTLTNTTSHVSTDSAVLSYNGGDTQTNQDVTMFYPTAETNYRITRAIARQGSKFQTGAHWHEDYDEYMRIIKGRARIRLGNTWKVYTPEDGEIKIARMVVHDICRADKDAKPGEEDEGDMIIEEWSDPSDGAKEVFFRHIFSSVEDKEVFGWKLPLQQLLVMMYSDGYIETVPGPLGWYFTHGLYAVLRPVAKMLGLKPFHDEYTPSRLADARKKLEGGANTKKSI